MSRKKIYLIIGPDGQILARSNKKRAWDTITHFLADGNIRNESGKIITYAQICRIERNTADLHLKLYSGDKSAILTKLDINEPIK